MTETGMVDVVFEDGTEIEVHQMALAEMFNEFVEQWLDEPNEPTCFIDVGGVEYSLTYNFDNNGRYEVWVDGEVDSYAETRKDFTEIGWFVFPHCQEDF